MELITPAEVTSAVVQRSEGGVIQQSNTFCSEGSKSSTTAFPQIWLSVPYVFRLQTGNTCKLFVS